MDNFREELRIIMNQEDWTDNDFFEAIDELHEKYIAEAVKLFAIPSVIESVGWIDVNLKLPSEGVMVDVKYTVGSINPEELIEKGKVNKRGRFSGEMDWKYATHWKPTVL